MAHYDLKTEQLKEMAPKLRAGDTVTLTGTVYTARDAAHKKIVAAMDAGDKLPFDVWTRSHRVCSMQVLPA